MVPTILRLPRVLFKSGYSRSTLYAYINRGLYPKPIKLGARSVGWPESEVDAINAARIAGMSDYAICVLVIKLEAQRKTVTVAKCDDHV